MRVDRFFSLYLFGPASRLLGSSGLPILMYHAISDELQDRGGYYETVTQPATFRRQMQWLHTHGYQVLALSAAVRRLASEARLDAGEVVLTFDDGFENFYSHAAPIMEEFSFTATSFLPTRFVDDGSCFGRHRCMSWRQVRELQDRGFEFGSHTTSHPQLRDVSPGELKEQIRRSKYEIEDHTGRAVDSFSYPFAFPQADTGFVTGLREELVSAGYVSGVTTQLGRAQLSSDPLFLPRLPTNSLDDNQLFDVKLAGGYDWVGRLQHGWKIIRGGEPQAGCELR